MKFFSYNGNDGNGGNSQINRKNPRGNLKGSRRGAREIDPDEVLLDASNLPAFDVQQFEGRLEKPIGKRALIFLGVSFAVISILYLSRVWILQVNQGEAYETRSVNNTLKDVTIFANRGDIYDRNGTLLAWDTPNLTSSANSSTTTPTTTSDFALRAYASSTGLAHLLGWLKYPQKDSSGNYYQDQYQGMAGVEGFYNTVLDGQNGSKITETDALGNVVSKNIIQPPTAGQNLSLSIDTTLNQKLYDDIANLAQQVDFTAGAGALMNIKTGEVLAMTSYPEYNSDVMTNPSATANGPAEIAQWSTDSSTPFLDRFLDGLYAPGSIVKPIVALGALNENVISPDTKILSTGSISIPDPYDPTKLTVFKDWRPQGWVDMEQAIAVSSDVYFYEVGGGYGTQKGLGIANIDKYMAMFGLGQPVKSPFFDGTGNSGTVPSIAWKAANFPNDPTWHIGDTYHTAIGQYGFQVSPIQMLLAVATIAGSGKIPTPTILLNGTGVSTGPNNGIANINASSTDNGTSSAVGNTVSSAISSETDNSANWSTVPIPEADFQIVQAGMHMDVQSGIAIGLSMPELDIAAKTGTAQVGVNNAFDNSWVEGFFPFNDPQYAFVVVMEHGPIDNLIGGLFVAREFLQWTADNHIDGV